MKLKSLEYFHKLSDCKSFSEVADFFNVKQPTVSYAIKQLEEELGLLLITRDQSHRNVQLTEAGKILAHHTNIIFEELTTAQNRLRLLKQNGQELRFGISSTIKNNYFSNVSAKRYADSLGVDFLQIEDGSEVIKQQLSKGDLDFALFGSTTKISSNHLEIHHLLDLPFSIAVSKNHPLAKHDKVSFAELTDYPFVIYNRHFAHYKAFYQTCQLTQQTPKVVAEVSDISIVKRYINHENAIGFMVSAPDREDICYIPLVDQDLPKFKIYLAYPKELTISDKMDDFKAYIVNRIGKKR